MNRPSLQVRAAGSPLGALLLLCGYAAVIAGWYQGYLAWWLAAAAALASLRTFSSVGHVRRYKAWLAEWNAMSGNTDTPRPKRKLGRGFFMTGAAVMLVAIPIGISLLQDGDGMGTVLTLLWIAAGLYLVYVALRSVASRMAQRGETKADTAPATWMLGRASSSPSRADAEKNLPEYCARLIAR